MLPGGRDNSLVRVQSVPLKWCKTKSPLLHFDWHQILNCFHLVLPPIRSLIDCWLFSKLKLNLFHYQSAYQIKFGLFVTTMQEVLNEWEIWLFQNSLRLLSTWWALALTLCHVATDWCFSKQFDASPYLLMSYCIDSVPIVATGWLLIINYWLLIIDWLL